MTKTLLLLSALLIIGGSPLCRADLPIVTVLHSFSSTQNDTNNRYRKLNVDGDAPSILLLQGRDGLLYGGTQTGGINGLGTLCRINPNGTGFTVLHTFSAPHPSSKRTINTDGESAVGALVQDSQGTLYGAAEYGGANDSGTLFKMNPDGNNFVVLHTFDEPGDHGVNSGGLVPTGLALGADGLLYGAARHGGKNGQGVLYSVETTGQNFRILHTFSADVPEFYNSDGASPTAALVTKNGTVFYGTTMLGNPDHTGVIYCFQSGGKDFRVLHNFEHQERFMGVSVLGALAVGPDGSVYGNTQNEGSTDGGVVFKLSPDGKVFTVLHSFPETKVNTEGGTLPVGPLVFGPDGRLYGLTGYRGASEMGTLFKVTTEGAKYYSLHDFSRAEGGHFITGLTRGRDGNLYGVSPDGGANGAGTIFRVTFPAAK